MTRHLKFSYTSIFTNPLRTDNETKSLNKKLNTTRSTKKDKKDKQQTQEKYKHATKYKRKKFPMYK